MANNLEAVCVELDCCPPGFSVPDITVSEFIEVESGNCSANCTQITGINVVNVGANYANAPTIVIQPPTLLGGVQATADPVMNGGKVQYVVITNPGSGYEFVPSVTFSGGNPTTVATAVATKYLLEDDLINLQTEGYAGMLS